MELMTREEMSISGTSLLSTEYLVALEVVCFSSSCYDKYVAGNNYPTHESYGGGFRVAGYGVPEPGTLLMLLLCCAVVFLAVGNRAEIFEFGNCVNRFAPGPVTCATV